MPATAKVKITQNGPYMVPGNLPLGDEIIGAHSAGESVKWEHGRTRPPHEQYATA